MTAVGNTTTPMHPVTVYYASIKGLPPDVRLPYVIKDGVHRFESREILSAVYGDREIANKKWNKYATKDGNVMAHSVKCCFPGIGNGGNGDGLNVKGVMYLLNALPASASSFRETLVEHFSRYTAGDQTLHAEIDANFASDEQIHSICRASMQPNATTAVSSGAAPRRITVDALSTQVADGFDGARTDIKAVGEVVATQGKTMQDNTAAVLAYNKELGDLRAENAQLSSDNGKLRAELRAADDARADTAAIYAKEVAMHLATVADIRKDLTAQVKQNIASNATISTLQTDNARVLDAHESLNAKYNEVSALAKRQNHKLGELRPVQTELAKVCADNNGLKQRVEDLEVQLRDSREIADMYRDKARKRTHDDACGEGGSA